MITREESNQFLAAIQAAQTIFVSAHVGPDGDTLGSMLGLKHALTAKFPHIKTFDCCVTGEVPDTYQFLPGVEDIINLKSNPTLLPQYDLAFCVDCGASDRMGPGAEPFLNAKHSINIDHHYSNTRFGIDNIIDIEAGASGEVVADLLAANDIAISAEAATCLYVAILTDTGGFKYSNTSAKVFEWAAKLTQYGADPENIYRYVYEESPKAQLMLQAAMISQAKFNSDSTLAWTLVSREAIDHYQAKDEYIDGLVELLRKVDTVWVSAMLKETADGHTKVSLRSDTHAVNVANIVAHWGGGGHKMAAGCTMEFALPEAEAALIPKIEAAIREAQNKG